ncbi:MAG: hypothetical protein LW892_13050, partial [Betaproteobacteria bacterium]|nr:hypothetical protein [Betaproteobacteria bacterium]
GAAGGPARILSWSYDCTLWLWDADSGEQLQRMGHEGWVSEAQWIAPGAAGGPARILSWSYDCTLWLWDADSGEQLQRMEHEGSVDGAQWVAPGAAGGPARILSWSYDHTVRLWDANSGGELAPPLMLDVRSKVLRIEQTPAGLRLNLFGRRPQIYEWVSPPAQRS